MCVVINVLTYFNLRIQRTRMQVMAVIDNLFLLATGLSQMFTASTLYVGITSHWFSGYLQTFVWPLVHITQMMAVYMTVLIACNRYIAICHPYRAERLCSLTVVRIKVSLLLKSSMWLCLGSQGRGLDPYPLPLPPVGFSQKRF